MIKVLELSFNKRKILNDKGKGDFVVKVDLEEISIGATASSEIMQIYEGMDWESGQIRISCKDKLIRKNKDRDIIVPIKRDLVFPKKYICVVCGGYVHKEDKYCCHCGQRLK